MIVIYEKYRNVSSKCIFVEKKFKINPHYNIQNKCSSKKSLSKMENSKNKLNFLFGGECFLTT